MYRENNTNQIPIAKPINKWARIVCAIIGHDWKHLASSYRHIVLCDLHPMAGTLADCQRCNYRWDDLPSGWEQQFPETKG